MNGITLQINDASVINEEWLKDENFQVAVKDAICEGVARKAMKLINISPDFQALANEVGSAIRKEFEGKMLTRNNWDYLLKDTYKKQIDAAVEKAFSDVIYDKIEEKAEEMFAPIQEQIRKKFEGYKNCIEEWMERNDAEAIFSRECNKFIERKFKQ